jgi:ATP/ADP translocase
MAYRRLQPDDEIKGDYFAHNKVYDSAARFTSVACAVIVAVFDVLALGNVVKSPAVPFLVAIVLEIVLGFSVAIFFTGVFNKEVQPYLCTGIGLYLPGGYCGPGNLPERICGVYHTGLSIN